MYHKSKIIAGLILGAILLLQTATFGTAYSQPTISEQIKDPLVYGETKAKLASDLWTKIFLLNSYVNPGDNFAYNIEFGNYGPADATDVNYSFSITQPGVSITNVVTEGMCEWDSNNVFCYSEYEPSGSSTFAQITLNVSEDASPALLMPTSDINAPVYDNVSTNNKSEIDGPAIIIPLEEESKTEIPIEEEPPEEIPLEEELKTEIPIEEEPPEEIPPSDIDVESTAEEVAEPESVLEHRAFGTCADGIDNDLDSLIDLADPGCRTDVEEPIQKIPEWIKNNAGWWAEGKIDDQSFVSGIEYLIQDRIIVIDKIPPNSGVGENMIPSWIKNNAGWWANGLISETSFLSGLEYMISTGIISNSILLGGLGIGKIGLHNADLKPTITQKANLVPMMGNERDQIFFDVDPDETHLTTAYFYPKVEVTVKNLGPKDSKSSTLIIKLDGFKHILYSTSDGKCSYLAETIICHFGEILKDQSKTVIFSGYAELSELDLNQMRINPEEHSAIIRSFPIIAIVSSPDDKFTVANNVDELSPSLKFENKNFVRDSNVNDVKELDTTLAWLADPYVDMPDEQGYLYNPKKGDWFQFEFTYGNNHPENPSMENRLSLYVSPGIDIEKWAKAQNCSVTKAENNSIVECDLKIIAPKQKITKFISVEITEDPTKFSTYTITAGITSLTPDMNMTNNVISGYGPKVTFD